MPGFDNEKEAARAYSQSVGEFGKFLNFRNAV
jgi:hypothetical protein